MDSMLNQDENVKIENSNRTGNVKRQLQLRLVFIFAGDVNRKTLTQQRYES